MVLPAETDIADIVLMLAAEADIADMALMTEPLEADIADMALMTEPDSDIDMADFKRRLRRTWRFPPRTSTAETRETKRRAKRRITAEVFILIFLWR